MKNILLAILLSLVIPPKGIYTIKIKDIDGGVTDLSKYHGKKMVFMVLSGHEPDSVLNNLAAFCSKYSGDAAVIGILSMEDGYNEGDKSLIRQVYKSRVPGLILTEAMYVRKSLGTQSELMQWFTHKEQNQHFDYDIPGPGWKLFVDEAGELYGILSPVTRLSSPIIQRAMNRHAKRSQAVAPPQKTS